jgi:hypothetical protein
MSVFNAFVRSGACGRIFHLSFADERTELACCTGNVACGQLCAISQNGLSPDFCWNQDMRTGLPATYFAIKAFSETVMTEDLKKNRRSDALKRKLCCAKGEDR